MNFLPMFLMKIKSISFSSDMYISPSSLCNLIIEEIGDIVLYRLNLPVCVCVCVCVHVHVLSWNLFL